MPKVNESGEPESDAPDQEGGTRGAKTEGDPELKGASATGGANPSEKKQT
jgi:hypothetical protein